MLEKGCEAEVLSYAKCTELPAPLKEGQIYVRAIAKVRKSNNCESYCIVTNNGTGKPRIKKNFGVMMPIVKVLEIYPLSVLDSGVLPDMRKKKELVAFLVQNGVRQTLAENLVNSKEDSDKEKLRSLIINIAVNIQIEREKIHVSTVAHKAEIDEIKQKLDDKQNIEEDGEENKQEDPENSEVAGGAGESGAELEEETARED